MAIELLCKVTGISLIEIRKSKGPKMDLWGTPLEFILHLQYMLWFEMLEFNTTRWYLPVKYDWIKVYIELVMP